MPASSESNLQEAARKRLRRVQLIMALINVALFVPCLFILPDKAKALRVLVLLLVFGFSTLEAVSISLKDPFLVTWSRLRKRLPTFARLFAPLFASFFVVAAWQDEFWKIMLTFGVSLFFLCELLPSVAVKAARLHGSPNSLIRNLGPFLLTVALPVLMLIGFGPKLPTEAIKTISSTCTVFYLHTTQIAPCLKHGPNRWKQLLPCLSRHFLYCTAPGILLSIFTNTSFIIMGPQLLLLLL